MAAATACLGLALLAVVLVSVGVPGGNPGTPPPPAPAASPLYAPTDGFAIPRSFVPPYQAWLNNETLPATTPSSNSALGAGLPDSAIAEAPPPPIPSTAPTVITFGTDVKNCCIEENFSAPAGPWETIVLNYTGSIVPAVYDSSYRGFIDGVQVLFGTSPEYGTWTVLENLSEYRVLFEGTTNLTFLLGAAIPSGSAGYFLTNLSIAFYPVPTGAHPPPEPGEILPLWFRQPIAASSQTIYANASVPSNASAAVIELFAYGFGPDEFWWANSHPARIVQFGVTGAPLGAVLPFPYVNTGGIDLFLWRPIPGAFTTADLPYQFNLTGDLGAIEGPHEYWANVTGVTSGSSWLIGGALLLWTNSTYLGATSLGQTYSFPRVAISGNTETVHLSGTAASQFSTAGGPLNVSSWLNESFAGTVASSSTWENVTDTTNLSDTTVSPGAPGGTVIDSRTYSFPITADSGGTFVETSTTGGGYPIYGNFTLSLLNVFQEYNALRTVTSVGPLGSAIVFRALTDDDVVGAQGTVEGVEEYPTSTSGPLIVATTYIASSSAKEYTAVTGPPASATTYSHLLVGVATQPPGPFYAEGVTTNSVQTTPFPLTASTLATPGAVDAGHPVSLTAVVAGGVGPYTVDWTSVPAACSGGSQDVIICTPQSAGTIAVGFEVRDALGDLTRSSGIDLYVAPALAATIEPSASEVDLGRSLTFSALVAGGIAPFACQWTVGGAADGPPQSCVEPFRWTPSSVGGATVAVNVTDAGEGSLPTSGLSILVGAPLSVALARAPGSPPAVVGSPVAINASVSGGLGPFQYAWSIDGAVVAGFDGPELEYAFETPGTYNLTVNVTDSTGVSNVSTAESLTVAATPAPVVGVGGVSTGSWLFYLLIALVVVEGAVIGILILRRPPKKQPGAREGSTRPAPSKSRAPPPTSRP